MILFYLIVLSLLIIVLGVMLKLRTSAMVKNTLLVISSLLFSLIVVSAFFDIKFYLTHGAWYIDKSISGFKKPTLDLDLKRVELTDDLIPLVSNDFTQFSIQTSINCRVIPHGDDAMEIMSLDGKDSWVELTLNATNVRATRAFYQGLFSVLVKNDLTNQASLTTYEPGSGKTFSIQHNHTPPDAPWHILSGFFYRDSYPNGKFITESITESFVIRLSTSSKVHVRDPRLDLARVIVPYPLDKNGNILTDSFSESRNYYHYETINRQPLERTYRIVFLGGSTTYGYGTGCSTTLPQIFKGIIKSRIKHKDGYDIEIINAGQPGNTSIGMLYQYDRTDYIEDWDGFFHLYVPTLESNFTIKDLKPNLVFLAPVYNDQIYSAMYGKHFNQYTGIPIKTQSTPSKSLRALHKLTESNAIFHEFKKFSLKKPYDSLTTDAQLKKINERLSILISKLQNDGAQVVLLSFPYMSFEYNTMHENDMKMFRTLAKKHGISFYDLTTYLSHENNGYWYDYIHPTAIGYNDYAETLFNFLFFSQSHDQEAALQDFRKKFAVKSSRKAENPMPINVQQSYTRGASIRP